MEFDIDGGCRRNPAEERTRGRWAAALALALLAAPAGAGGAAERNTATAALGAGAVEAARPADRGPSAGEHAARGRPPSAKVHHGASPRRAAPAARRAHPPPAPSGTDDYLPPMG